MTCGATAVILPYASDADGSYKLCAAFSLKMLRAVCAFKLRCCFVRRLRVVPVSHDPTVIGIIPGNAGNHQPELPVAKDRDVRLKMRVPTSWTSRDVKQLLASNFPRVPVASVSIIPPAMPAYFFTSALVQLDRSVGSAMVRAGVAQMVAFKTTVATGLGMARREVHIEFSEIPTRDSEPPAAAAGGGAPAVDVAAGSNLNVGNTTTISAT